MKHASIITIFALSIFTVSCGKLQHKDNKSPDEPIAQESQDAVVDTVNATVPDDQAAATNTDKAAATLAGKDLYAKLCASCHAAFDKSEVAKTTRAELDSAIDEEPTMNSLKTLTAAERDSLIEALSTVSPGKGKGKKPN